MQADVRETHGPASRPVFRKVYRYGLGRSLRALEGLLGALNVAVIAGWGSGARPSTTEDSAAPGLLGDPGK